LIGEVQTAATYRLYALDTQPPKPGYSVSTAAGRRSSPSSGTSRWLHSVTSGHAAAAHGLRPGRARDGSLHVGFQCEAIAIETATDITEYGGWRAYRASVG